MPNSWREAKAAVLFGFTEHSLKTIAQLGTIKEMHSSCAATRHCSGSRYQRENHSYLPGTLSYLYLARLLEKRGLTFKDIRATAVQPAAMPLALQGGLIDGVVTWEPWISHALKLSAQGGLLRDPDFPGYQALISVTAILPRLIPKR